MVKIRWSQEADGWLREIYAYIATENSAAAANVIAGIYDKVQLLKDFPHLGHKYRDEQEGDIRILQSLLQNLDFRSKSRHAKNFTAGIYMIFRG